MKKLGFTLAEVLITLAIVGVIAAMVLPPIMQNLEEKTTINRLKKAYSELSKTYLMIKNEKGDPTSWLQTDSYEEIGELFIPYLEVSKNCKTGTGCFSDNCYSVNGEPYWINLDTRDDMSKFILTNGTSIALKIYNKNCDSIEGNNEQLKSVCGWIVVDTNGKKKPNTYGIDIFEFKITKYDIYPYGTEFETLYPFPAHCDKKNMNMSSNACTAWVLYNENLDYLRCPEKLGWNKAKKCN